MVCALCSGASAGIKDGTFVELEDMLSIILLVLCTYSFDLFFVMRQQRKLVINRQIKLQHERLKQVKPRVRASPAVTLGVSKDLKSLFWSFFGPFPPRSFMVQ